MLIGSVTLLSTLVFLKGTESVLLEPVRQCAPTAMVRGPCHVCVCSSEGIFHCRLQKCQTEDLDNRPTKDCEPDYVYREDNIFCTCSKDGYWKSDKCDSKFKFLQPNIPVTVIHQNLRTNIACTPNNLYLIDCNFCRCGTSGVIDITLCTNRYCSQGYKADSCTYGDILRLEHEICSCSDIDYYIDRLCITILNQVVQTLQADDIIQLVDIGRSWRRLRDLQTDVCNTDMVYEADCNKCVCVDGHLTCTIKVCELKKKTALRLKAANATEILPELKSFGDLCKPGQKYRYKCNTCVCSPAGTPSCTTMLCIDDFVVDLNALRGALSNS